MSLKTARTVSRWTLPLLAAALLAGGCVRSMKPQVSQMDWSPLNAGEGKALKPQARPPADKGPSSLLARIVRPKSDTAGDPFLAMSEDDAEVSKPAESAPELQQRGKRPAGRVVGNQAVARTTEDPVRSAGRSLPAHTVSKNSSIVLPRTEGLAENQVLVTANRPPGKIPVVEAALPNNVGEGPVIRPAGESSPALATAIPETAVKAESGSRAPVELLPEPPTALEVPVNSLPAPGQHAINASSMPQGRGASKVAGGTLRVPVQMTGIESERLEEAVEFPVLTAPALSAPDAAEQESPQEGPTLSLPEGPSLPDPTPTEESSEFMSEQVHPLAPQRSDPIRNPRITSASRTGLTIGLVGLACIGLWRFWEWRRFRNARA